MKKLLFFGLFIFLLFCNISYAIDCEFLSPSACAAYKAEDREFIGQIFLIVVVAAVFVISINVISKNQEKKLKEYNKKHKKKIRSYDELKEYLEKKENEKEIRYYKKQDDKTIIDKEEKKKRIKEERVMEKVVSSSNLGASLKRLKKMYNDGHLSKVEFEKAKNKLLK